MEAQALSNVFSRLFNESCTINQIPRTPHSIFIQNYTLVLQLDINLTILDFKHQRSWDTVCQIVAKEFRIRRKSYGQEAKTTELCNDIAIDGLTTYSNKDKEEELLKVNKELADLVNHLYGTLLENLTVTKQQSSSISLKSSCTSSYSQSRKFYDEEREESGVEDRIKKGALSSGSESSESIPESVNEYEQEESESDYTIDSSARTSLLSSLSALEFSSRTSRGGSDE
jgi:hypothetical protein